jgi:esterase/lipase
MTSNLRNKIIGAVIAATNGFSLPQERHAKMSSKRNRNEDIRLIENLVQDQLNLIESRLRDIEQSADPQEALKKVITSLIELQDSSTLIKILLSHVKDNDNGHAVKAGVG